jgi:hypothetical protein
LVYDNQGGGCVCLCSNSLGHIPTASSVGACVHIVLRYRLYYYCPLELEPPSGLDRFSLEDYDGDSFVQSELRIYPANRLSYLTQFNYLYLTLLKLSQG